MSVPTKAALSPARQRLVILMQSIHFGRVENLVVRRGEPVFDPPPAIVREIKFGGDNGPHPERDARDFQLKAQVVELFRTLDRLADGKVLVLDVKHGLPFRMLVADSAA